MEHEKKVSVIVAASGVALILAGLYDERQRKRYAKVQAQLDRLAPQLENINRGIRTVQDEFKFKHIIANLGNDEN